ncbi:hypothetical protein J5I95_10120 [Candidatus Poribacteria bacterium]|nr:hypothetical protein [Candidatus Poribacteria bacterium]
MLHPSLRNPLFIALLITCCLIAIGGVYKSLTHTLPANPEDTYKVPTPVDGKPLAQENNFEKHNHHASPPIKPDIPEGKLDRIDQVSGELHMRRRRGELTPYEADELYRQKEVSILVEGMDNLSAARYLRMRGGYDEFVREYAAKALNEDPDNFEALYIFTKTQELEVDRVTGFRRLLEMNPDSVPVLTELGAILARDSPEEAIEYMERANQLEPDTTLYYLGISYQRVGEYDKALVVLKRADELNRAPMARAHIKAIEAGTPRVPLIQREVEEPLQPETEEQETAK